MNKIVACGVPRSASTLIWQILDNVLPGQVIKRHPASWEDEDCRFIVGSIRHPYDTAASCFRTRMLGDTGNGSQETVRGTKKGLIAELRMMNSNFEALKNLIQKYPDKIEVLRYEDFFTDFTPIFTLIEKRFGVEISTEKRKEIYNRYSFEANRKRTLSYKIGERHERMGVSHVAVGVPGSWKSIIPFWGYNLMSKWCDHICKEWNYEG